MTTTTKKTAIVGHHFWAKKFDTHAHIIVGGSFSNEVYCGKFGALLGNNYANYLEDACPVCVEKMKAAKEKEVKNGL